MKDLYKFILLRFASNFYLQGFLKANKPGKPIFFKSNCGRALHSKQFFRQFNFRTKMQKIRCLKPLNRKRKNLIITISNFQTACKGQDIRDSPHPEVI